MPEPREPTPVVVATSPGCRYPGSEDAYSPDERYPEYAQREIARAPNPVYAMLRGVLAASGLDAERLGSPAWNPLGVLIPRGASVFVLCNFVYHRRPSETEPVFQAKCIHGSVLRALIDYVLLAVGPQGRVRFGNAPLQSCDWGAVQRETGAERVESFYRERARQRRMTIGVFPAIV